MQPSEERQPAVVPAAAVQFRVVENGALTERDLERMLELIGLGFDLWPLVDPDTTPADHLRWKTSSPAAIVSAVLGEAGNELVTTDTCVGHRVLVRGQERLRMQFVDHSVRPEWRGRGVSSASLAFRQRNLAHLYDLSISDAQSATMIHRARKFGTRPFGNPIHPLILPLRPRELARRWARSRRLPPWTGVTIAALLRGRSLARRAGRGRPALQGSFKIVAIDHFDDRIDRFFAAASAPWELIVVRSREHLDWRYCDRRAGAFQIRAAEGADGAVLGYAIGKVRGDQGYLADLLALPGRPDVVAALVTEIDAALGSAGCVNVACWLPARHPYRAVLHRSGFLDARRPPLITCRPCRLPTEALAFLEAPEAAIHFMLGDTDLV